MLLRLRDNGEMLAAADELRRADPELIGRLIDIGGPPTLRQRPFGFAGLAAAVVAQQVSTASANAIFGRLRAAIDPFAPDVLLGKDDAILRACGLSAGKIRTLRAIAASVMDGTIDFEGLILLSADEARITLTTLPGVGPWTAEVFLLFGLGHADILPAGDLALQEALRLLLGSAERPSAKTLARFAERWRPYRGVAAHLLWAYYRGLGKAGPLPP